VADGGVGEAATEAIVSRACSGSQHMEKCRFRERRRRTQSQIRMGESWATERTSVQEHGRFWQPRDGSRGWLTIGRLEGHAWVVGVLKRRKLRLRFTRKTSERPHNVK
jgi:hypothetical protein